MTEEKTVVEVKEKPEIITGILALLVKNKNGEEVVVRTEIELPNDKFSRKATLNDIYRLGSELQRQVIMYESNELIKKSNKPIIAKDATNGPQKTD